MGGEWRRKRRGRERRKLRLRDEELCSRFQSQQGSPHLDRRDC